MNKRFLWLALGAALILAGCGQGSAVRPKEEKRPAVASAEVKTGQVAASAGASQVGTREPAFVTPESAATFARGFNLGNRLDAPKEGDWGPALNEQAFGAVAARGFDHLRLPVRFSGHALEDAPHTLDSAFMERVDWAIAQGLQSGLSVILDFQYYDGLMSEPEAHRSRFLALWEQIAERYRDLPEHVAFELLNEPNGKLDAVYNELMLETIGRIRKSNPNRLLLVDSVDFASAGTLEALELPEDEHLMATVHLYGPKLFTLQGVPWLGPEFGSTGIVFPGPPDTPLNPVSAALELDWAKTWFEQYNTLPADENPSGPGAVAKIFETIAAYQSRSGHAVYIGEIGTSSYGPEDSRVRFLTLLRESCEAANMGWSVWDNNGYDMALLNPKTLAWQEALMGALIPAPK